MTQEERTKELLKFVQVRKAGFAGTLVGSANAGMLVDRRDYPADFDGVIPLPKNDMLGIPAPRCIVCEKVLTPTHYKPWHSSCPHTPCDGPCNCG